MHNLVTQWKCKKIINPKINTQVCLLFIPINIIESDNNQLFFADSLAFKKLRLK